MASGDIVLQLGLREGEHADATVAAQSLIAWVDVLREAARAIDPGDRIRVELIGREEGSLRQLLRIVEDNLTAASEGASEYPHLKTLAIGLAFSVGSAVLQAGVQEILQPEVQKVEIVAADPAAAKMAERVRSDDGVNRAARRFFRTVEQDRAVTNVQIAADHQSAPIAVIPRSQFPERGGLWQPQEEAAPEETRRAVWTVVLVRAAFTHTPRAWTFSRDGLPFSARMEDPEFLAAIAAKTVPITIQEGVIMQIEIEYRERLDGQVWEYVDRSRKVVRVLSPRPLPVATAPHPHGPKE